MNAEMDISKDQLRSTGGGKADSLWTAPNSRNWRKNVHLDAFYFLGILWILRNTSLLHSICTWTSSTYSFSFWGSLEALIITKKDKVWIKGAFRPKLLVFIVCTSLICTYVGNMLYTLTRYVYIFEFKEIENTYFERCFCLRKWIWYCHYLLKIGNVVNSWP